MPLKELRQLKTQPRKGKSGKRKGGKKKRSSRKNKKIVAPQMVDVGIRCETKDEQLEEGIHIQREEHRNNLERIGRESLEVSKQISVCNENVVQLNSVIAHSQKALIVEKLRKQIQHSFAEFETETKSKQQHIHGLSLENSYQIQVSLLAKLNNKRLQLRNEILTSCPKCSRMILERADSYCKVIKNLWEQQAVEAITNNRIQKVNEDIDNMKKELITQSIDHIQKLSAKFEKETADLFEEQRQLQSSNETMANDYFTMLVHLNEIQKVYNEVKGHLENCLDTEVIVKSESKYEQIQSLRHRLRELNSRVSFRTHLMRDRTDVEDLKKTLAEEQKVYSKLNARIKQLTEAMDYTLESFKHSNKVHSENLQEMNNKIIPDLCAATKQKAKEVIQSEFLGLNPLKQQFEKQSKLLVAKKSEGIMLRAEQIRLIQENTRIRANLNWLDNAIGRTESDSKSCKIEANALLTELENTRAEIDELETFKREATKVVNKMHSLVQWIGLNVVPQIDCQRWAFQHKKQAIWTEWSKLRITLRKLSEATTKDTLWGLIKEVWLNWGLKSREMPMLDRQYESDSEDIIRVQKSAEKLVKQVFAMKLKKAKLERRRCGVVN